jgi:hypothetical protein
VFRILAALLVQALCVEAVHKALFFFSTVRIEPPIAITLPGVQWHWWPVASWVYRTRVFLLVCVLFRLTRELEILHFKGTWRQYFIYLIIFLIIPCSCLVLIFIILFLILTNCYLYFYPSRPCMESLL